MSLAPADPRPRQAGRAGPGPAGRRARAAGTRWPQLRLVPADRVRAARAPFVLLVLGLLGGGLLVLLLLNTIVAQNAFTLHDLHSRGSALASHEQALRRSVEAAEAPSALAARARELGMIPAPVPVFLRLPEGTVLGAPKPAGDPSANPSPGPAASPTAAASPAGSPGGPTAGRPTPTPASPSYSPGATPRPSTSPSATASPRPTTSPSTGTRR